jgi:hypothetical protein
LEPLPAPPPSAVTSLMPPPNRTNRQNLPGNFCRVYG